MKRKGAKLENTVNWVASVIGGVSLVGMVVLISLNVISRFLFATSFNWAEEVTYMLFNWAVFFGVVVVYRYQGLTAIDVLVNALPEKARRVVLILNYALNNASCVALVVWGW